MKAKKGVVEFLNKVLTNELTAINQYFLHAEMCGNWGYTLLHETVPEQLKSDLGLEHAAVKLLTEAVEHCVKVGDFNTRSKLEVILTSEEEHIDWIEMQMETIKQVGVEIYLSQHMH
jgi:bacterioferritin